MPKRTPRPPRQLVARAAQKKAAAMREAYNAGSQYAIDSLLVGFRSIKAEKLLTIEEITFLLEEARKQFVK